MKLLHYDRECFKHPSLIYEFPRLHLYIRVDEHCRQNLVTLIPRSWEATSPLRLHDRMYKQQAILKKRARRYDAYLWYYCCCYLQKQTQKGV